MLARSRKRQSTVRLDQSALDCGEGFDLVVAAPLRTEHEAWAALSHPLANRTCRVLRGRRVPERERGAGFDDRGKYTPVRFARRGRGDLSRALRIPAGQVHPGIERAHPRVGGIEELGLLDLRGGPIDLAGSQ